MSFESCPFSPVLNLSQDYGLFQWVSSSHQVFKSTEASASVLPISEHWSTGLSSRWGFYIPEYVLRTGVAGLFGRSTVNFWQTSVMFSIATTSVLYIRTVLGGFQLFTSLQSLVFFCYLSNSHPYTSDVTSHCGFDLHFPDYWCWASFHVSVSHLYIFFGEMAISVLCLFSDQVFFLLPLISTNSLYFGYGLIIRDTVCKYFLPLHRLPLQSADCFLCCADIFSLMQCSLAIFAFLQLVLLVSYLRSHCID